MEIKRARDRRTGMLSWDSAKYFNFSMDNGVGWFGFGSFAFATPRQTAGLTRRKHSF